MLDNITKFSKFLFARVIMRSVFIMVYPLTLLFHIGIQSNLDLQPITLENAPDIKQYESILYGEGRIEEIKISRDNGILFLEMLPSNILYPTPPTGMSAYAETLQIWDLQSFRHLCNFAGHTQDVHHSDLSPDGRYVASASSDGTLRLWSTHDCSEIYSTLREGDYWRGLGFSGDSRMLFVIDAYDNGYTQNSYIALLDVENNFIEVGRWQIDRVSIAAFSLDSQKLAIATANGEVFILDISQNEISAGQIDITGGNAPRQIWFSQDSQTLYVQLLAGSVRIDISQIGLNETITYTQTLSVPVSSYQYTEIGVTFARNNQPEVINLFSGERVANLPPLRTTGPFIGFDWNDAILLTIEPVEPDFLNLYNAQTGALLIQLPQRGVFYGLFSFDNRLLVSWSNETREIIIWGVR